MDSMNKEIDDLKSLIASKKKKVPEVGETLNYNDHDFKV